MSEPKFISSKEILAVGTTAHYSFAATEGIPGQWQKFMEIAHEIPNKIPGIPIGVATNTDDDGFDYLCGVEVTAFAKTKREFIQLRIPARRYAIFEHLGHISTLSQTYAKIWDEALPALGLKPADAPHIERHKETFDPRTGEGGVDIWIPLVD